MTQSIDLANAINSFVKGCKTDGTWDAIKACCIMAAWDGLDGALYPLKGTAPTNNNFVSGDYNRETGLKGDGSTKYLDSNRANNSDPQNSNHNSCFITQLPWSPHRTMGVGAGVTGGNLISGTDSSFIFRNRSSSSSVNYTATTNSLSASSRNSALNFTVRVGSATASVSLSSQTPFSGNILIFQSAGTYSNARLSFYSIGESLDLALLDNRVSTLMTDIGAAIP